MKRTLIASLLALFPLALSAQTPYLVKDINTTRTTGFRSSNPFGFFPYAGKVYFVAQTATNSTAWKLCATDGTESGTGQLGDVTVTFTNSDQPAFVVLNNKLLFNARDSHGSELWMTDGTVAGTRMLADVNSIGSSLPGDRIVFQNKLFFSADDGLDGRELWVTDGTPVGTRLFKDLLPGTGGSGPRSFVLFNGAIYFATDDGLWKSDGTEAGTVRVKAVAMYSTPIVVSGSLLYFEASTKENGGEVWVSDGTADGTRMITDLAPGIETSLSYGSALVAFGNRVLFFATDQPKITGSLQLWISDGTAGGTHPLRNVSYTTPPAVAGSTAYFVTSSEAAGTELWKTDGSAAGTSMVSDIFPGMGSSYPHAFAVLGEKLYFAAQPTQKNASTTLWVTDGTASGTHTVRADGTPQMGAEMTSINGALYFAAANLLNGFEPWKSDGTDAGTSMIANLNRDSAPSSSPSRLIAAGDWIYFEAWEGLNDLDIDGHPKTSVWRSDGTSAGTLRLTSEPRGYDYWTWLTAGHSLFFNASDWPNPIWRSDGTPESTAVWKEFAARFTQGSKIDFALGDTLFVTVPQQYYATEEWATSLASAAPAAKLTSGSGYGFIQLAGRALFWTNGQYSSDGPSLWSSDGTAAGTFTVFPRIPVSPRLPVVVMGGNIYWSGNNDLWKSDGTYEGTKIVKQLPAGPLQLLAVGRNLYFTVDNQLWMSDGTDAGTRVVVSQGVTLLNRAGERVVFVAYDAKGTAQPWVSDGTTDGTRLLADIISNINGPTDWVSADNLLYFAAFDSVHGSELWVTDGTPEGTKLVADLEPGLTASLPRTLVRAGDRVYFSAITAAAGNELWALPLPDGPRLSVNDVRVGEGETTARFTVTLSAAATKSVTVDYATSDASATAGSDYDATSGTLTFAPGETSRTIDVRIHGDANAENNESFFLTLRNASNAQVVKSTAFAIIEDEQIADLALSVDFSFNGGFLPVVRAKNNGPRAATQVQLQVTQTPYATNISGTTCQGNCPGPQLVNPGATETAFLDQTIWPMAQRYITVTANAHQRDPDPSNNVVRYMTGVGIAMEGFALNPGADAKVFVNTFFFTNTANVESSNPAVISVPSTVSASTGYFIAHAAGLGRATIKVTTSTNTIGTLEIEVVAPGTPNPRWPGGVDIWGVNTVVPFDQPEPIHIYASGTSPFTNKVATGTVVVTSGGIELARVTLDGVQRDYLVNAFMPEIGSNLLTATYSGDANFLPSVTTSSGYAERGLAAISAQIHDNGSTATVHVRVIGSPMAAPEGKVYIGETSVHPNIMNAPLVSLTKTGPGVSEAEVTLTNLPGAAHTFRVYYPGDGKRYNGTTQDFRTIDMRKHTVRH